MGEKEIGGKEIVGNGIEGDGDSWKWDYRGRK